MKKFFGVIFLLCFLVMQNVSAEKTDVEDKSYNFKAVKKVVLHNIKSGVSLDGVGSIQQQKMMSDYTNDARKKLKADVLAEGDGDLIVDCKITTWKNDYYIVPEHTVWERQRQTRRVKRDGNWVEESYYITVPMTYPPRRVDTSDLVVEFEARDARTGQIVFAREDNRRREDESAQLGMFGRMCNSFFSDLGKRIKK